MFYLQNSFIIFTWHLSWIKVSESFVFPVLTYSPKTSKKFILHLFHNKLWKHTNIRFVFILLSSEAGPISDKKTLFLISLLKIFYEGMES